MVLEKLKPELVWSIFENIIATTPHISYHDYELHTSSMEYVRVKSKETFSLNKDIFFGIKFFLKIKMFDNVQPV